MSITSKALMFGLVLVSPALAQEPEAESRVTVPAREIKISLEAHVKPEAVKEREERIERHKKAYEEASAAALVAQTTRESTSAEKKEAVRQQDTAREVYLAVLRSKYGDKDYNWEFSISQSIRPSKSIRLVTLKFNEEPSKEVKDDIAKLKHLLNGAAAVNGSVSVAHLLENRTSPEGVKMGGLIRKDESAQNDVHLLAKLIGELQRKLSQLEEQLKESDARLSEATAKPQVAAITAQSSAAPSAAKSAR